MIQSIIGTSFISSNGGSQWPTAEDPGGGVYEISGSPSLGLFARSYAGYFNDNVAAMLTASPSAEFNVLDFNFNANSNDNFSLMWTGYIQAPDSGNWKFRVTSDDSSYFWIGSDAVVGTSIANADVNNGGLHGSTTVEMTTPVALLSGYYYPIRAMFGEDTGAEVFYVEWNKNNTGWSVVNPAYLRFNAGSVSGF